MFVDSCTYKANGKTYTRHLLRESFREDGKVRHRTLMKPMFSICDFCANSMGNDASSPPPSGMLNAASSGPRRGPSRPLLSSSATATIGSSKLRKIPNWRQVSQLSA